MVPTARVSVSSSSMPTRSQTRAGETDPERSTTLTPTLASMRHWGGSVSVVAIVMATAGGRFAARAPFGLAATRAAGAGGAAGGAAGVGGTGEGLLAVTTISGGPVGGDVGPASPKSEFV